MGHACLLRDARVCLLHDQKKASAAQVTQTKLCCRSKLLEQWTLASRVFLFLLGCFARDDCYVLGFCLLANSRTVGCSNLKFETTLEIYVSLYSILLCILYEPNFKEIGDVISNLKEIGDVICFWGPETSIQVWWQWNIFLFFFLLFISISKPSSR